MQLLETLLWGNTFLFLIILSFFGKRTKLKFNLFWIGVVLLVFHILFEVARWQMTLTYVLFFLLTLLLMKRSITHLVFRIIGFILGLLLILLSAFYAIEMPIIKLPKPSGEFLVGTTNFTLVDESRAETKTDDPKDKRELFVEAWYPGKIQAGEKLPKAKTLWSEMYSGQRDRVSFFMNYLRGITTNAFPDVSPDKTNGPFPVILFNHGLQMFSSQNTLLMEHLASHGFVVVSIAHPYESLRVNLPKAGTVLPEFITSMEKFQEGMAWIEETSKPVLAAIDSMENTESKTERARIILNAIEHSPLNEVVDYWVADNQFVLDQLLSSDANQFIFNAIIDTSRIGAMGMSIGGATAGELCKADKRIKAGINVDGLQYGTMNQDSLPVPFMMMYSKDNPGTNDFLLLNSKNDFHEYYIKEARHADFTDLTLIWPVLGVYGQLGNIPGKRMIQLTNEVISNFWDHYLKGKPYRQFKKKDFPELEIYIKN